MEGTGGAGTDLLLCVLGRPTLYVFDEIIVEVGGERGREGAGGPGGRGGGRGAGGAGGGAVAGGDVVGARRGTPLTAGGSTAALGSETPSPYHSVENVSTVIVYCVEGYITRLE